MRRLFQFICTTVRIQADLLPESFVNPGWLSAEGAEFVPAKFPSKKVVLKILLECVLEQPTSRSKFLGAIRKRTAEMLERDEHSRIVMDMSDDDLGDFLGEVSEKVSDTPGLLGYLEEVYSTLGKRRGQRLQELKSQGALIKRERSASCALQKNLFQSWNQVIQKSFRHLRVARSS